MPTDAESSQPAEHCDAVLWGTTTAGRTFRPTDWCDRLAGLTSAFGADQKVVYSPLVCPVNVQGQKALIVSHELATAAPRLYQFLLGFARDNELTVSYVAGAIDAPRSLTPPAATGAKAGEPREPV